MIGRVARGQGGFALVELLVASVLMIVVMGAAFDALQHFEQTDNTNTRQNDAQDAARNALDLIVKRLRNDAAPTPGSPQAIERATSTDLIFQTVDPNAPSAGSQNAHNIMRVRYCLDTSNVANEKIWMETQNWTSPTTPAQPSSVSCPDPGWASSRVLLDHVVNGYGVTPRPLWTIDCPAGYSATQCTTGTDQTMLASVKRLAISLYVDVNVNQPPTETRLSTGIFFRNQNAKPNAVLLTPNYALGHIYANASSSSDPDADRMFYRWCYFGSATPNTTTWCANGTEIQQHTVSIDYVPSPAPRPGAPVSVGVRVEDQGGLVSYDYKQVTP